jgi:predicted PurR-regulated permease PerM
VTKVATPGRRLLFWGGVVAVFILAIWLLSPVLFPFVVGLAIAYVLDPGVDRIERWGISRTVGTIVVMIVFFLALFGGILLLAPILYDQFQGLSTRLREAAGELYNLARPYLERVLDPRRLQGPGGDKGGVDLATGILSWAAGFVGRIWSGGLALFNILSTLFITPVVVFYLLRDWDRIVATVDLWLPRDHAPVIREQMREIDKRMAGFLRGQGLVCIFLGIFYAVGLTLVGLNYGLIIGLVTGLVSFIPYLGMLVGAGLGLVVAFFQYESWWMVGAVALVFAMGQFIEGNFVSPILVGDRVGLHPVWVMLAVLAGGALFGFVGLFLAVPAAAAIAVVLRYLLTVYLQSSLYRGPPSAVPQPPNKDEEF